MESAAMGMTWMEILRTSIVMPVLLVLSVLVVAQALERTWVYWRVERMPESLWLFVKNGVKRGALSETADFLKSAPGTGAEALADILERKPSDVDTLLEGFPIYRQKLQMRLSSRLGLFGTVSFISPLIGLLGTVLGVMRAFHDLARAGTGGPTVVAAGISEALVATAAGIAVAVLSSVVYNFFTMTLKRRLNLLDYWGAQLADVLKRKEG